MAPGVILYELGQILSPLLVGCLFFLEDIPEVRVDPADKLTSIDDRLYIFLPIACSLLAVAEINLRPFARVGRFQSDHSSRVVRMWLQYRPRERVVMNDGSLRIVSLMAADSDHQH